MVNFVNVSSMFENSMFHAHIYNQADYCYSNFNNITLFSFIQCVHNYEVLRKFKHRSASVTGFTTSSCKRYFYYFLLYVFSSYVVGYIEVLLTKEFKTSCPACLGDSKCSLNGSTMPGGKVGK